MSTTTATIPDPIIYPDSDGKPMAESTLQYEWIVTIKGNLDVLFRDRDDVFVAGDNLIYPVKGDPATCQAPDVYVSFGRPKGHRGSYKVWAEAGIFPQVIFEIWSPSNTRLELDRKREFYDRFGVEEYYEYDPERVRLLGWIRNQSTLRPIPKMHGFTSPLLGIRFDLSDGELAVYSPEGKRFLSFVELGELQEQTAREAKAEKHRADREAKRAEAERAKSLKLAARLRELGIDPDSL